MQVAQAETAELQEAWGDWIDPLERLRDDWEFIGGSGSGGVSTPYTTIDDRKDGAYRPFYQNEQDLALIRACGRGLSAIDSIAIGAVDALEKYTFGSQGFKFKVQATKGQEGEAGRIVAAVQRSVDRFLDENDFSGELDTEIHRRTREDGESIVALRHEGRCGVVAETIEPDQLLQPASPSGLYAWLHDEHGIDCESFVPSWSFGVLTRENRTYQPIGYHVVYDGSGRDWDFLPASHVVHFKRNVSRNAKRGVSDFYPIAEDARNEIKLRRNTATGAALQASIPWIEEFPAGTTQASVAALGASQAEQRKERPRANGGSQIVNARRYQPGTIVRTSAGRVFKSGPMGTERADNFVKVAGFIHRCIGVRWNMPEYMISGDASNANYASTLVAESPFVKARESDQQWYGRRFRSLLWKVVRLEFDAGTFTDIGFGPGLEGSWGALCRLIEIAFDAPAVATRDPYKLAQTHEIQLRSGTVSRRTAMIEQGRDPEQELAQGAKPQETAPLFQMQGETQKLSPVEPNKASDVAPQTQPATEIQDAALNGAQIASLLQVVNQVTTGEIPFASARATLQAAFPLMRPEQLEAIMRPLANFKPPVPETQKPQALPAALREAVLGALEDVHTTAEAKAILNQVRTEVYP